MDAAYYEELAGWLYGLALEEIAGTLAQDAIAIIGNAATCSPSPPG